ncbi:NINE protein [Vagococcus penaei]
MFFVLALTLGFLGAQWFYAKNFQKGIMYLLFSWTFIPFFISLYQAFKALFILTDSSYKIFV